LKDGPPVEEIKKTSLNNDNSNGDSIPSRKFQKKSNMANFEDEVNEGVNNPDEGASCIEQTFFLQYFTLIRSFYQSIKNFGKLTIRDIPIISRSEDYQSVLQEFWDLLLLETEEFHKPINPKELLKISWKLFKPNVIFLSILMFVFGVNQILLGFFLKNFLQSLFGNNFTNEIYIWGAVLCLTIGMGRLIYNHYFFIFFRFGMKFRATLITILYWKIIGLSSYSIKQANLSKLINIVSNDMNNIEFKIGFLPVVFASPFIILFGIFVLWFMISWTCLITIIFFFILFILKAYMFLKNNNNMIDRNKHSDARLKICSEVIDGIRPIKMYAWESTFNKLVQNIRENEINCLIRYNFTYLLDRAISGNAPFVALYLIFLTYINTLGELTLPVVFATVQILEFLRNTCLYFLTAGISLLLELQVITSLIIKK
jgi:ABC-type multidrug transport system fused ATPase/permease subunit